MNKPIILIFVSYELQRAETIVILVNSFTN